MYTYIYIHTYIHTYINSKSISTNVLNTKYSLSSAQQFSNKSPQSTLLKTLLKISSLKKFLLVSQYKMSYIDYQWNYL